MTEAHPIRIKRVYARPSAEDGKRILVDRLWPRGLRRESAALTEWFKEAAPSSQLRKWFAHDPQRWDEFSTRYRRELDANPLAVAALAELLDGGTSTLLYAARDERYNHARALADYMTDRRL